MNESTVIKQNIVGIGAVFASKGSSEIAAYAIGSCIALCLYDPISEVGAMAHILLPSRNYTGHENCNIDVNTKYADHALSCALKKMYNLGAKKNRIQAAMIGGAHMFPYGNDRAIDVGKMNINSVAIELENNNIPITYSVTGGKKSRSIFFRFPANGFDEQIKIVYPGIYK